VYEKPNGGFTLAVLHVSRLRGIFLDGGYMTWEKLIVRVGYYMAVGVRNYGEN
jgi:hypothetical protein